jgi:hypothetical protein
MILTTQTTTNQGLFPAQVSESLNLCRPRTEEKSSSNQPGYFQGSHRLRFRTLSGKFSFSPIIEKRMADNRNNRDRSNSSMGLVVFAGLLAPQKQPTA